MVKTESSRVITMNYTYEIQITKFGHQLIVKESENNDTPNLWSLSSLFNWQEIEINSRFKDSLLRTKEWLKMKHPEIIMKFLILEDGVYDRNDVPMIFWKFSELNKKYANEKDWKMQSFERTKTWILDNYPELMI